MAIEMESRWDEGPRTARRIAVGILFLVGNLARWTAFSVLTVLAPLIRIGLAIAAIGGFLVILLALAHPHRQPFPYGMIVAFSVISAVLYTLFDRLLAALQP